jgi:hypothetical protein
MALTARVPRPTEAQTATTVSSFTRLLSISHLESLVFRATRPLDSSVRMVRTRPSSMGFLYPTTLPEAGSDLRRVCLARLCCASRLSQPLDALFRPQPSSLVSCRLRPWVSTFRDFPSPVAGLPLGKTCPSCRFVGLIVAGQDNACSSPGSKGLRIRRVRSEQAGVNR